MELRLVDLRTLKPDPNNPRRTKATPEQDTQLTANIRKVGVLQPPVVRPHGNGELVIVAGERRVKCAIAAGLVEDYVLVRGPDDGGDAVRSLSENVVRQGMSAVDQWRAIEALVSAEWTEEAISAALALPVRTIRKLRLLANICPAMLDQMARGDMPEERILRVIAAASAEEQAAVWKKHKPRKGQTATWWEVGRALEKRRIPASVARFDDELARAYGIRWTDDLFAPAGEDARTTDQVDEFFAAQHEWLAANLPANGHLAEVDQYGRAKLPLKARETYSKPGRGDHVACYVDPRTGEVKQVAYRLSEPKRNARTGEAETPTPPRTRPDVTGKGIAMIGDLRTEALHQALRESPIEDDQLLGMLVLALGARNVDVRSGVKDKAFASYGHACARIADQLTEGGALTRDMAILRHAAREMLVQALSCREGHSQSGMNARYAGTAIGADLYLPNMATPEFLKCLSKPAIERAASAERVLPRNTGKETRAALIAHVGTGTYVHPAARFAPTAAELASGGARFRPAAGDGAEPGEDGNGKRDGQEAVSGDDANAEQDDIGELDEAEQHGAMDHMPPGYGDPAPDRPAA